MSDFAKPISRLQKCIAKLDGKIVRVNEPLTDFKIDLNLKGFMRYDQSNISMAQ